MLFAILVGVLAAIISFLFVKSLRFAINFREENPWMILLLPLAGIFIVWLYGKYGKDVESGNNLILDEIHEPQKIIPLKIIPMIFLTSTLSHLFGASVGREGVAVQMGAGISDALSKYFHEHRKIFLMMGMSAGFASIFGAPLAGTIFGIEVFALNFIHVEALFPCLISGVSGYFTAYLLGLHHDPVAIIEIPPIYLQGIISAILAGICFGLTARLFSWATHSIKILFEEKVNRPLIRPLIGGSILIICYYLVGSDRYLNLGEAVIRSSFNQHIYPWDFLGKLWTTAVSIGAGFKGGEVTPLFFIGATLGNSLAYILWLPYPVLAGMGYVSVFSGAANTPLTGIILAMELFGADIGVYAALAVVVSYLFSGSKGIYSSQRGIK